MSDPTYGAGETGASRVEAMLAAFSRQGADDSPPADAPAPPPAVAGDARAGVRSAAVRPLWSAGGAAASGRPWSQWLQWRPLWALIGVVVGVVGNQLWHELRQQEQRDIALASVSRGMQGAVRADEPIVPAPLPAVSRPAPVLPAQAAPPAVAPADEPAAATSLPVPPSASVTPTARTAPTQAVRPGPAAAPPRSSSASAARAAAARPGAKSEPAAKRPPPSPATVCKSAKGADFERCLQIQCRKDRYFAHRQCIALYERAIRP